MATYNAAPATVIKATCQGLSSSGALSIPGLQIGDVVIKIQPAGFDGGFEDAVSIAGQLQQTTNLDWSPVAFTFYLLCGV
ncbi:hypothetical protein KDW98_31415 [Burkholderia vietnamiensis]|uniref:hypothetical protein n=1 Tax=Burkholderia vietnamiensis TaxID=60552 RepID=UPI001B92A09A|nr:hypothetical protein [Burkholderia vietnamiensis]MBR8165649.1 hypothetical protein [Burkholderia vietnamiensis]MCA8147946.1 hypothetical protein [Burkholderia vietnamiensis]